MKVNKFLMTLSSFVLATSCVAGSFAMYLEIDLPKSFDINVVVPKIEEKIYVRGLKPGSLLKTELMPNLENKNEVEVMAQDVKFNIDDKFELAKYKGDEKISDINLKPEALDLRRYNFSIDRDNNGVFTVKRNCTVDFYVNDFGAFIDPTLLDNFVFLKPNANWITANARFATYFFGANDLNPLWVDLKPISNKAQIYYCELPDVKYKQLIFTRMNPATTENNWDNRWTQTSDLNTAINNLYTIAADAWEQGGGSWSLF